MRPFAPAAPPGATTSAPTAIPDIFASDFIFMNALAGPAVSAVPWYGASGRLSDRPISARAARSERSHSRMDSRMTRAAYRVLKADPVMAGLIAAAGRYQPETRRGGPLPPRPAAGPPAVRIPGARHRPPAAARRRRRTHPVALHRRLRQRRVSLAAAGA